MTNGNHVHQSFPEKIYSDPDSFGATRHWFDRELFLQIADSAESVDSFVQLLLDRAHADRVPAYFSELVTMEAHVFKLLQRLIPFTPYPDRQEINPTLKLFANAWSGLAGCIGAGEDGYFPQRSAEQVIIWMPPGAYEPRLAVVTDRDLLILKMTVEGLTSSQVAETAGTYAAAINSAIRYGLDTGIILGPRPEIRRSRGGGEIADSFSSSREFSLQWHITQACDLHCRHCYDRTPCESLSLDQELRILDQLSEFCLDHHVFGHVSFTGGNPLLHPHFHQLYREASARGFTIGILGNPASESDIESFAEIQPPEFYQVSLEGLEEHNDYIRGDGHFRRVFEFLDLLRKHRIYSKVMLTLTRANLDQVIPLGKLLQDKADVFTFNRLSSVGEGANLAAADPADFEQFLEDYIEASKAFPVFGLKDNLFNIILDREGTDLFGGCTGFGCGAAFNFVSILATGDVHACRKFPSYIGNITSQSLADIYHSPQAQGYREGPEVCRSCRLQAVCRGCLAVQYSSGDDNPAAKDPYCFFTNSDEQCSVNR